VYTHIDFPRRVALEYDDKLKEEPEASKVRRLVLLKEAMRKVSGRIGNDLNGQTQAVDLEDKLGVAIKFIRASECGALNEISSCIIRYPYLKVLVENPYAVDDNHTIRLQRVRDHAIDLAREKAIIDLNQTQDDDGQVDQARNASRKKKASRLLYKSAPGKGDSIGAIRHRSGKFLTDPSDMASALRDHWGETFTAKGIDEHHLKTWLDEDAEARSHDGPSHESMKALKVRKRDVRKALKLSNNSAPGPDGIPYGAWRSLGDLAVTAIHDAFSGLSSDNGQELMQRDYPNFNESLLFFLKKKPVDATEDGVEVYDPEGVRPLNVTNADNRLIASAVRLVIEPVLGNLITDDQRGFITGRSMLSNLIDVDEAMITTAMTGGGSVAIFYDFAAAFPSVEHTLLHSFFAHLGWPTWLLNMIITLYLCNFCQITIGGTRVHGFNITRGIRQGCPLSPLLFAVATDLLLRRLHRAFPRATSRAWADDLAMTIPDGMSQLGQLCDLFRDFHRVSGLELNIPKTVIVPLYPFDTGEVRVKLAAEAPDWGGCAVSDKAKYLGFFVGPGRRLHSWTTPLAKFLDRSKFWGKMGLGTFTTLQAYQVFIGSVLLFVAQLDPLPDDFDMYEGKACKSLFTGPTGWMTPGCLKELKSLRFPRELPDIRSVAIAAKARVARFECLNNGGLNILRRAHTLSNLQVNEQCTLSQLQWITSWRDHSFLYHLRDADRQLCSKLKATGERDLKLDNRLGWQGRISKLFQNNPRVKAQLHLRRRLDRWNIQTLPGWRVQRAEKTLDAVANVVNPRVIASFIRLLCNGWITGRRFQGKGPCSLCRRDEDSIEHFAKCSVVMSCFKKFLGLHRPDVGLELDHFLCMNLSCDARIFGEDSEELFRRTCRLRVLGCYALYKLHNSVRHGLVTPDELQDAFGRFVRNGEIGADSIL